MKQHKDPRGGARPNAGRKPSGILTGTVIIRHNEKIIHKIRTLHTPQELAEKGRRWLDSLISDVVDKARD